MQLHTLDRNPEALPQKACFYCSHETYSDMTLFCQIRHTPPYAFSELEGIAPYIEIKLNAAFSMHSEQTLLRYVFLALEN